jgi:hypothetical protein
MLVRKAGQSGAQLAIRGPIERGVRASGLFLSRQMLLAHPRPKAMVSPMRFLFSSTRGTGHYEPLLSTSRLLYADAQDGRTA